MSYIDLTETTAPLTPATNHIQLFVDTADKHVKQIDDTGTIIDLAGGGGGSFPLLAPDGTVTTPSYSFASDSTSGLWFEPSKLHFAIQGEDVLIMDWDNGIAYFNGPMAVQIGNGNVLRLVDNSDLTVHNTDANSNVVISLTSTGGTGGHIIVNGDGGIPSLILNGQGNSPIISLREDSGCTFEMTNGAANSPFFTLNADTSGAYINVNGTDLLTFVSGTANFPAALTTAGFTSTNESIIQTGGGGALTILGPATPNIQYNAYTVESWSFKTVDDTPVIAHEFTLGSPDNIHGVEYRVTAVDSGDQSAMWIVRNAARQNGSSVVFAGTTDKQAFKEVATWDVDLIQGSNSDLLALQVTGDAINEVHWSIVIHHQNIVY